MTSVSEPRDCLDQVLTAVSGTTATGSRCSGEDALAALTALHELRDQLLAWEPVLIEAARDDGVSWARLAPALGVTSRQAAERRYLRLRPAAGDTGMTREERVQAARDERAGDRAVAAWARANASELRQMAGQASAVTGLGTAARRRAKALASSLTEDDPTALLAPLSEIHRDLVDEHAPLAARIDAVGRKVSRIRRDTQRARDAAAGS